MARYQQVQSAAVAAAASGDNTVVAAVTGKKIRVLGYTLSALTANNVKWKSGAGTDKTGLIYLPATGTVGSAVVGDPSESFWFETAAGAALVLNLSAATAVGGVVVYQEI